MVREMTTVYEHQTHGEGNDESMSIRHMVREMTTVYEHQTHGEGNDDSLPTADTWRGK